MNTKNASIFDEKYVSGEQTKVEDAAKKSALKGFLKQPLSNADLSKYGTSKPFREVIKGYVHHGQD